jgi:hypothetical protein
MPRRKKPEEDKKEEPSFEIEEEIIYEKLGEQEGKTESKKESNSILPTPILRQAKVVLILKHKNEIIIELPDHTGERIQYNPDIHSQLKEGDLIDVP